nr:MAG TPA: hypothetical protein [Caudoviricetes sp.]
MVITSVPLAKGKTVILCVIQSNVGSFTHFPYTSPVREHRALFNQNIHFLTRYRLWQKFHF